MFPLRWAIAACWAVFMIVWAVTALQTKTSVQRVNTGGVAARVAMIAIVFLFALAMKSEWLSRTPFPYPVEVLGVALTIAGVAFAIWARLALGSNWGMPMTVRENPELVTGGPYAFARHPIYTGVIFALVGSALVMGPAWFVIFVFMVAYFAISAKREERDMVERFPDAYPAYRARTRMLIPFVY
jgi:protein-S-isoprenylcysteine O-methyltransferase Ste14